MRTYAFFLLSISSLYAAKPFLPMSYTISLERNDEVYEGWRRRLTLKVNEISVGYVEYTIATTRGCRSFVHYLHVNQSHRNKKGYGKVLFYTALKDIVQAGSKRIELQRCPFDLSYDDNFVQRDTQLKKWYSMFGFKEKNDGTDYMQLINPALLRGIEVVSRFTDSEVQFNLEQKRA